MPLTCQFPAGTLYPMNGKRDLVALSEYVFRRTWYRLTDLTDGEYFWEPAPNCWSVRVGANGDASVDRQPRPGKPPFTTIAWRLWHLIDCYGADRNEKLLLGTDDGRGDLRCAPRPTAGSALQALDMANESWTGLLSGLSEDALSQPLGPDAGPYSQEDKAAYVLHQLDEMIHHGAELGVLRDLYAALRAP
jgi:DinB superfamily